MKIARRWFLITTLDEHEPQEVLVAESKLHYTQETEITLLVGVDLGSNHIDINSSLDELTQLIETAGAEVVHRTIQKRSTPDRSTFIGKGKVEEVSTLCAELNVSTVVFDDELSPTQQRNLEQSIPAKVIDRTSVILDIFAQRARTREGKLQVELAQLKYLLPRLSGRGSSMSRLGGGIGTRGPGETKLEVDRRKIRKRLLDLEHEIDEIKSHRILQRESRVNNPIPTVALVGYTNAGKSTILNLLTDASVLAEDKLFATLDPTTRKLTLPSGMDILLTDTVGFIQKLPHHLISAFRATLEEIVEADLMLHVIDVSHPDFQAHSDAVYEVLEHLKASEKSVITVLNKVDKIDNPHIVERETRHFTNGTAISAKTGQGIATLLLHIEKELLELCSISEVVLHIPYSEAVKLNRLHDTCSVIKQQYEPEYIEILAQIPSQFFHEYRPYVCR